MNLLLDTHIALWAVFGHKRLPVRARDMIRDTDNRISVSAASVWEIAIKHGVKPAEMPVSAAEAIGYFSAAGYEMLSISPAHARAVEELPGFHSDPFDRMLVAQSLSEPLRLLTHDPLVARYSDAIIRV